MTPDISERAFEDAIECALLRPGPDACSGYEERVRDVVPPYGDGFSRGRYHRRRADADYDRQLCLIPRDVVDFLIATQPRTWKRLEQHHGTEVRERFLSRLAKELERRGALDVFRTGVKDSGCTFQLAYFRPASGLNEETRRLHAGNIFSVVRQLRYSTKNERSLDLVLFLNGIPFFTQNSRIRSPGRTLKMRSASTGMIAILANRSSRTDVASRTSPWIPSWCTSRRDSRGPRPASCPSTAADSAAPVILRSPDPKRILHGLPLGRSLGPGQRP